MSSAKKQNVSEMKLRRFERPATIKEHVYNTLREQLLHNEHKPNGRLIEREITDQLGVSRTPVREALSRLASDGLLVATKHGYKVPEFTREDVLNVFEVRMLLEPVAARQAAENPSSIGLAEMQRAIQEEKAAHAKGAVSRFLRANVSFRDHWLKRRSFAAGDPLPHAQREGDPRVHHGPAAGATCRDQGRRCRRGRADPTQHGEGLCQAHARDDVPELKERVAS
jgi:hypothetical protein